MKLPFIGDRRGEGRRTRERRATTRGKTDRRDSTDRRVNQRREFVRLVYPSGNEPQIVSYPPEAAPEMIKSVPEIIATDFRIADLSKKAIRFTCLKKCSKCDKPIPFNKKIAFTLKFHDGETLDLKAEVTRYFAEVETKAGSFVAMVSENLPSERITKEQSFLLKTFPEFCRESQTDKRIPKEEPAEV